VQAPSAEPVGVLSAAPEKGWRRCRLPPDVTEIEVRLGRRASADLSACSSAALYRAGWIDPLVEGSEQIMGEGAGSRAYNGMPAGELREARWWKSGRSSAQGNCIETAKLSGHEVAVRNSRYPQGPALIFSQAEVCAFLEGVKDGDFDDLL
jgi:hypothetical protein